MHLTRRIAASFVLALSSLFVGVADAPASGTARPVLELDASWFDVVEPYRYDESRRYERGWNRGADARVPGAGAVRSPVDGRVRFAGAVAGRLVVTLDASVDGMPVVVTLTGLDELGVHSGARVGRGSIVGGGGRVHVGMYDPDRRSRYLPVVAAPEPDAAAASDGPPTAGVVVAGGVAGRLHAAILGEVGPRSIDVGAVSSGADTAARSPARQAAPTIAAGASTSPMASTALHTALALISLPEVASGSRPGPAASIPEGSRGDAGRSELFARAVQSAARDLSERSDAIGMPGSARSGTPPVAPGVDPVTGPGSASTLEPSLIVGAPAIGGTSSAVGHAVSQRSVDMSESKVASVDPDAAIVATAPRSDGSDVEPSTLHTSSTAGGDRRQLSRFVLLAALLLALGGLVERRRRGRRRRLRPSSVTTVFQPAPLVLPERPARLLAPVETDGSTIVPGGPLAWSDRDPGTLPDTHATTDTPARARRRAREPA
jgi:hypothetical protein